MEVIYRTEGEGRRTRQSRPERVCEGERGEGRQRSKHKILIIRTL